MIVQSFRSVMWVGAVAGAALSCYMVSLRVASERAALEGVESRILMAKRDIRALDTELSTRGRLRQLEKWNVDVLALSAPTEGQFLGGEVALASLTRPMPRNQMTDPVVLAAAAEPRPQGEAKLFLADLPVVSPSLAAVSGQPRLVRASAPVATNLTDKPAKKAAAEKKPAGEAAKSKLAKATTDSKPKEKAASSKPALATKQASVKPASDSKAADKKTADLKPTATKPPAEKKKEKLASARPAINGKSADKKTQ